MVRLRLGIYLNLRQNRAVTKGKGMPSGGMYHAWVRNLVRSYAT